MQFLNWKIKIKKWGTMLGSFPARGRGPAAQWPAFARGLRPKEASHGGPAPRAMSLRSARACRHGRARTQRGYRDHGWRGDTGTSGEPDLKEEDVGHGEHLGG
jgi:hypothetical protein